MSVPAPGPGRVLSHVLLFTVFLWGFPGVLRALGLNTGVLVGIALFGYLTLLAAHLVRSRLGGGSADVTRFALRWVVAFPAGTVAVNVLLVRALLAPDPVVGASAPLLPERGMFVVQGKVAQIVYSAVLIALANGVGVLWWLFAPGSTGAHG